MASTHRAQAHMLSSSTAMASADIVFSNGAQPPTQSPTVAIPSIDGAQSQMLDDSSISCSRGLPVNPLPASECLSLRDGVPSADRKLAAILSGSLQLKDYVWPEKDQPRLAYDQFEAEDELPIIDLGRLSQGSEGERQKLVDGAKEWGCFRVVNHGVPLGLIRDFEQQACLAFCLPPVSKENAAMSFVNITGPFFGYTAKQTANNPNKVQYSEYLRLPLNQHDRREIIAKLWPEGNEGFSSVADDYIAAVEQIHSSLLMNLTSQLGLDPSEFMRVFCKDGFLSGLRVNYYPTCDLPSQTMGFGAHSDPHALTILHQNDVGGLQILKNRKWIAIKPKPGSFFCNVGDTLEVISNGYYTSAIHRAVVNSEKFRMSVVYSQFPHINFIFQPAPQLVTQKQPAQFRPYTSQEYLASMLENQLDGNSTQLDKFRIQPSKHQHGPNPNAEISINALKANGP